MRARSWARVDGGLGEGRVAHETIRVTPRLKSLSPMPCVRTPMARRGRARCCSRWGHAHTHAHATLTYIYICIYIHTFVCMYMCMYMCIYVHAHARTLVYVYIYTCMYVYTYVYTHTYIYIYTYIYIHIYIYIYTHTYVYREGWMEFATRRMRWKIAFWTAVSRSQVLWESRSKAWLARNWVIGEILIFKKKEPYIRWEPPPPHVWWKKSYFLYLMKRSLFLMKRALFWSEVV